MDGGVDGGPDRDRTGDLVNAIHARSQLRYWPTCLGRPEHSMVAHGQMSRNRVSTDRGCHQWELR